MKIIQVVPFLNLESSGLTQAVVGLCLGLQKAGCNVALHSDGRVTEKNFGCPVFFHMTKAFPHPKFLRSPAMLKQLKDECQSADIIHNNSLWTMLNVYPEWATKGTRCKHVLQPHGTLSKWALANSKWKKWIFGCLFQHAVMRKTAMWVATCEDEYNDIRRLGYKQPVAILPNGVDLPMTDDELRAVSVRERRRMYFLSRIHPKKNLGLLLRCWAKLEPEFADWDLSIVGPDKNNPYADEMKVLAKELGCQRVTFEGELNGDEKFKFVAESECFVLPTHSENFGMVVAEALACKTPAMCSYGAPWAGLNEHQCGWWIPTDMVAFEETMRQVMSMSRETLAEMGERGREWMARDFSWDGIGAKMKAAYAWLLGQGEKPDFVRVD